MKNTFLIDTHILLWWLSDDKKLSKKMRHLIEDPEHCILVSSVSVWEIGIKKALKKLSVPDNLKELIEVSGFEFLSMTVDHALHLDVLPAIHNDPFDRLLIAQCLVEDITFVTADKIIPQYGINCF